MSTVNEKMGALADAVRDLSGTSTKKTIDVMTTDVNSANVEILNQFTLLDQISTALENKVSGGVKLPTLTNPASASDIISGKEAIGGGGNIIVGTIPAQEAKTIIPTISSQTAVAKNVYTTGDITVEAIPSGYIVTEEITAQDSLISQIQTALQGKAAGGGGVEMCTVTLVGNGPASGDAVLSYSDGSELKTVNFPAFGSPNITVLVLKNSIIAPAGAMFNFGGSNLSPIYGFGYGRFITGDAIIYAE